MADNPRVELMLENFGKVRDEIMTRAQWRDAALMLQLTCVVVLAGLAAGVKVNGVEAPTPAPWALIALSPISSVLCGIYVTEDWLIGYLGKHVAVLAEAPEFLAPHVPSAVPEGRVPVWDGSAELRQYGKTAFFVRFAVQVVAFVGVPAIGALWVIVLFASAQRDHVPVWLIVALCMWMLCIVLNIVMLWFVWSHRRSMFGVQ